MKDGTYTVVLNRIEDDLAVLAVRIDDRQRHEIAVDLDALPAADRQPDAVFEIQLTDGELTDATYHETET